MMFFTHRVRACVSEKRESGPKWMSRSSSPQDVRGGNTNTASDCAAADPPPEYVHTGTFHPRLSAGSWPPPPPPLLSSSLLRRLAGCVLKCENPGALPTNVLAPQITKMNVAACLLSHKNDARLLSPLVQPPPLKECTSLFTRLPVPDFSPANTDAILAPPPAPFDLIKGIRLITRRMQV